MKIYTKTGDAGQTGLFRGPRVPKHDPRVVAYGNVDELNALLGIIARYIQNEQNRSLVSSIQHELFELGADLATPQQSNEDPAIRIPASMVERLEREIDHLEESLPPLKEFILPGGSSAGAWLHYARTVCRRAERSVTKLNENDRTNPHIIPYLNRLSDLLFVLARSENQTAGESEIIWKKRK